MASVVSATPVRYPSGVSTDQPWQALAMFGQPNPFMYHVLADDFDTIMNSTHWTETSTGNGSIALTPGDGGLALFTTNSSTPAATDIASIQNSAAGFTINGGLKKAFFLTRLQLSSATNAAFLTGLIQQTTTPFTVTDGVYFSKATGSLANLTIKSAVGSTITTLTIPTAAYTLANATYIDLAFYIDRNSTIFAFVDSQLVGYIPQSGSGSTTPNKGAVTSFSPTLTTANLTPTLAIQSGTAASSTMTADFIMAAKER